MKIYVITENNFLFTGVVHSLSPRMNSQFIQLNPLDKNNYSTYEDSDIVDIYILAPEYLRIDFDMLVALNKTRSSVIIASSETDWNVGRVFSFSKMEKKFSLSDLLQCIFTLRPSGNKQIYLPKITSSERSVLLMTLNGVSIDFIGFRLDMAIKTVYSHQKSALRKLGVRKFRDIVTLPENFIEYVCGN